MLSTKTGLLLAENLFDPGKMVLEIFSVTRPECLLDFKSSHNIEDFSLKLCLGGMLLGFWQPI